jgi:hypothetical protein
MQLQPLLKGMGDKNPATSFKPILDILLQENYNWVVSDIDDYFLNKGL